MDKYIQGVSVTAGSYMLKWDMMDLYVRQNPIRFQPGDNINVFINFESIMDNLFNYKNLNYNINYHKQDLVIELESAILNLVANYKSYFNKEKCKAKIYLYYTDLESDNQYMRVYNKYYRTYYQNKYTQNPKFRNMGDTLKNIIIPEIILILSYIPDAYFIKSTNFDSSIIPYIISENNDNKNIIISGDIFDTLYLFNPNFMTMFIKRKYQQLTVCVNVDEVIQYIIRNESPFDTNIFKSEMYYKLLLSINGSPIRNIKTNKNINYGLLIKSLKEGIDKGIVLKDFESISSIIDIFPDKHKDDLVSSYKCMSIINQYDMISDIDKDNICNQIIDKIDMASLEELNNRRFINYPINLQSLLV